MSLNRCRSLKVRLVWPNAFCMRRVTMANLKREKQRSPLHRMNLGKQTFLRVLSLQVIPVSHLVSK